MRITKYTYYIYIAVLLLFCQQVSAQRIIRRNSRHYVAQLGLPDRVDPILQDRWHQEPPYNSLCPIDTITNKRSVVGCVATSMSQVMHYWQWPERYDWDNMLDNYEKMDYTDEQVNAVAQLALDCGQSVKMKYTSSASGARSVYQAIALANEYEYNRGLQMYFRDFYSLEEMTLMLKKELAAGRPVLVSGYRKTDGHAFVIDGYDERDWFHVSWGNPRGIGNEYTYLPYLSPDLPGYNSYLDSPENGYNVLQMFTIGVMPNNHPFATNIERHNYGFGGFIAHEDSVIVQNMSNVGWNMHEDSVSLMLMHNGERVCPLYTYSRQFLLEEVDDTAYTDTLILRMPEDIADGTYTILPMYRDNAEDGGKEWREVRTSVGMPNYLIASVKDGEATFSSDTASIAYLTLEDVDFPDFLVDKSKPDYSLRFRNHGPEMAGQVYLFMESLDVLGKDFYLQEQGITVGADEEFVVHNKLTPLNVPKEGTYKLHIFYSSNLFGEELEELEWEDSPIVTILPVSAIELAMKR